MYLADLSVVMFHIGDKGRVYRKSIKDYWKWRDFDRIRFSQEVYKLKRRKLINVYKDGKDKYLELTPKGIERLKGYQIEGMVVKIPETWDRKWRIVIFDIPDDKKTARDILRDKLKQIGFIQLQESVFIYPFECKNEIDYLTEIYHIKPYVKYIVADFFDGDDLLIEKFLDEGILSEKMIKGSH